MDDKAEKVALFRYGLIAPLVLETLPRPFGNHNQRRHYSSVYDDFGGIARHGLFCACF